MPEGHDIILDLESRVVSTSGRKQMEFSEWIISIIDVRKGIQPYRNCSSVNL